MGGSFHPLAEGMRSWKGTIMAGGKIAAGLVGMPLLRYVG